DLGGNFNVAATQVVVRSTVVEDTVGIIGSFLDVRSRMILQSQPELTRRLDRVKGQISNNGGVSGFGLSVASGQIPFAAQVAENESSFSYSLRRSQAKGQETSYKADVMTLLGHAGIRPTHDAPSADASLDDHYHQNLSSSGQRSAVQSSTAVPANDNLTGGGSHASDAGSNGSDTARQTTYPLVKAPQAAPESQLKPALKKIENPEMVDRFDVWAEGKNSRYNAGGGDGLFSIIHAGVDYRVTRDLLIGIGAQFDWTTFDASTAGEAEGFGFMVGPYLTARMTDRFFVDGRLAWGQSENSVSPYGTYTDDFDTDRWLGTLALIGDFDYQAFNIRPELRVSYFTEQTDAYTDTLNNLIPSVEVETGTLEFGPTFSTRFMFGDGYTISPRLTTKGIWTFAQNNSADTFSSDPATLADEGLRGSVEAGLGIANDNGLAIEMVLSYDGIGDDEFETWGVRGRVGYRW
ncbi:MAG: autotransporter outer membrane beta-barrel domain-containing protein, partial [Pseudomonadota bacterium]